jgi:signal transduction histidine kinase
LKNPRPIPSIRRQLTLQILAGGLGMLLVAGLLCFAVIHRRIVGDFDRMLEAEAAVLARNAERKGHIIVWDLPDAYSDGSRQNGDPVYCQLFLEDGTVAGVSQTLGTDDLPRIEGRKQAVWNVTLPNGRSGRILQRTFSPFSDDAEPQAGAEDPQEQTFALPATMKLADLQLVVVVARSREGLDRLLGSLGIAGGAVALGLAGGLALLVRRAITRGLRPIDEINAQIAAIAPDAFATRLHIAQPPVELATIETAVNRLLDRVEGAFEEERRFSSDLAHELRTPIAELRTACEVGGRWPEDVEATRQLFQDTRTIALHLEKIVGTMLALAHCENGSSPVTTQRIFLQPLVRACWQRNAAAAAAKHLRFDDRIPPGLAVECDEDKLGIIFSNLVENAVAHSEPGTVVECGGGPGSVGVDLWLVNTARDLERADLEHVFDRFWRKDVARSDRSHIGLGLSITRRLCEILHIRLGVELSEHRLFKTSLTFPAQPGRDNNQPH